MTLPAAKFALYGATCSPDDVTPATNTVRLTRGELKIVLRRFQTGG